MDTLNDILEGILKVFFDCFVVFIIPHITEKNKITAFRWWACLRWKALKIQCCFLYKKQLGNEGRNTWAVQVNSKVSRCNVFLRHMKCSHRTSININFQPIWLINNTYKNVQKCTPKVRMNTEVLCSILAHGFH